ncbi:hypothetical protein MPSEU_000858700 [Mayamaea pseudoterrestris]|nr:hypothetical protein MPSEU_000858700 [Mayamaea pseudoterrestris]
MGSSDYRKRIQLPRSGLNAWKRKTRISIQGVLLLGLSPILYTLWTLQFDQPLVSRWTLALNASSSPTLRKQFYNENDKPPRRSPTIPLRELVQTHVESTCPPGLVLVNDTIFATSGSSSNNLSPPPPRNIPRVIHMTGKTRCMPPEFVDVIQQWQHFDHHEFYFHNEAAMQRLLKRDWPEFPQLYQVLQCTKGGAGMADVWRALIMWEYGGIYSDIDNAPANFDAETSILPNDDAYFVMERSNHLSQYFFAARPKHPLFYLLVQHMTSRLLALNDVSLQVVSLVTGPGATREAFCNFINGQGPNFPKHEPSSKCWYPEAKLHVGMNNYTVRAVGTAEHSDEYVARDVIPNKNLIYKRMNMTYFRDLPKVESKESCIQRIYNAEARLNGWNDRTAAAAAES